MSEKPDWIETGTKVLCYTVGRVDSLRVTEIAKVASKSFVLTATEEGRFRIAKNPSRHEGGTWGWSRCVIPLDSDEARKKIRMSKMKSLRTAANYACRAYIQDATTDNRLAAIAALQAVEEDEEPRR